MKKKKKKLSKGGVLIEPTIAIVSDETQRGNYTGYTVCSKKLIELAQSQGKDGITLQGAIIDNDLVIKPKVP
jgi:hypothetical protein